MTKDLFRQLVTQHDDAGRIDHDDRARCCVERPAKALLVPFSFSNIEDGCHHQDAAIGFDRVETDLDGNHSSALRHPVESRPVPIERGLG